MNGRFNSYTDSGASLFIDFLQWIYAILYWDVIAKLFALCYHLIMGTISGNAIPIKEREKIRHEINNLYYPKYDGLLYIAHRSVGLDNGYYIYLLENHAFDGYLFLMRYDNLDDEDIIL